MSEYSRRPGCGSMMAARQQSPNNHAIPQRLTQPSSRSILLVIRCCLARRPFPVVESRSVPVYSDLTLRISPRFHQRNTKRRAKLMEEAESKLTDRYSSVLKFSELWNIKWLICTSVWEQYLGQISSLQTFDFAAQLGNSSQLPDRPKELWETPSPWKMIVCH